LVPAGGLGATVSTRRYRYDALSWEAVLAGESVDVLWSRRPTDDRSDRGRCHGFRDPAFRSADGAEYLAFAARGANPTGAGLVILPDGRGLPLYDQELAARFVEASSNAWRRMLEVFRANSQF
jgi:hypothetical protein